MAEWVDLPTCPVCGTVILRPPGRDRDLRTCATCFYASGVLEQPPTPAAVRRVTRRLSRGDDRWRKQEVDALVAHGDLSVPVVSRIVQTRHGRAREAAALVLGRIAGEGSSQALNAALDLAARKVRWFRRARVTLVAALCAFVAAYVGVLGLGLFVGSKLWGFSEVFYYLPRDPCAAPAVLLTPIVAMHAYLKGLRRRAESDTEELLGAFQDPKAAGMLAKAHQQPDLADHTGPVLARLLPELQEEHAQAFTAEHRSAIYALMDEPDPSLARLAVRAAGRSGCEDAIRPLRSIAQRGPLPLQEEARASLDAVRRRIAVRKEAATLLRAAGAGPEESETLLRPAGGAPDADEQQLLRRTDDPDAEADEP
jgi:hypothetical protein